MTVTMKKADGAFMLTSDPNSAYPPSCQMFKGLCYTPVCCSVSQPLRRLQGRSQSVLGMLHIIVGILIIGLSISRDSIAPMFWIGCLYIFFGILCILSEKFPSPCLVIVNVILNVMGAVVASLLLLVSSFMDFTVPLNDFLPCKRRFWDYTNTYTMRAPESLELQLMLKKCQEGNNVIKDFLERFFILLTLLSALELCINISSVVLGIKALKKRGKEENKLKSLSVVESSDIPGDCKKLLVDASTIATV